MDLRRTPGRMTLGQLHERLCLRGREPIGGTLRPGAVIRQCSLEGREGAVAPFIEDAAAHAAAGGHLGDGLAPEQREDGLEPVFPGGARGLWGGMHIKLSTSRKLLWHYRVATPTRMPVSKELPYDDHTTGGPCYA
jgi:hypothetical protein